MGIYVRGDGELFSYKGAMEYVLVFEGTSDILGWLDNYLSVTEASSPNLEDAKNFAKGFVQMKGDYEITFVGHSKGGGEAIVAALSTNRNAITFNAANFAFRYYGGSNPRSNTIDNYYVRGEILCTSIGRASVGTTHWIDTQYYTTKTYTTAGRGGTVTLPAGVPNHSMNTVIKGLR